MAGGCYYFSMFVKRYREAAAFCAESKAELLTVENRREYAAMVDKIRAVGGEFFGGKSKARGCPVAARPFLSQRCTSWD